MCLLRNQAERAKIYPKCKVQYVHEIFVMADLGNKQSLFTSEIIKFRNVLSSNVHEYIFFKIIFSTCTFLPKAFFHLQE